MSLGLGDPAQDREHDGQISPRFDLIGAQGQRLFVGERRFVPQFQRLRRGAPIVLCVEEAGPERRGAPQSRQRQIRPSKSQIDRRQREGGAEVALVSACSGPRMKSRSGFGEIGLQRRGRPRYPAGAMQRADPLCGSARACTLTHQTSRGTRYTPGPRCAEP